MELTRCENGHFYDAERFASCPHCSQPTVSTVMQDESGEPLYTMPLNQSAAAQEQETPPRTGLQELISEAKEEDGSQTTIGYFGEIETEPVVGWLVAIEGVHFGEDFKLKTGRNFIGRSANMDVALTGDPSISRDKHAILLYEPKSNMFLVQPGDAKELCYLNDKVVLSAVEIVANDILTVGDTKLLFIPLCTDKFNWDSVKKENAGEKE